MPVDWEQAVSGAEEAPVKIIYTVYMHIFTHTPNLTHLRMTQFIAVLICDCNAVQEFPEERTHT